MISILPAADARALQDPTELPMPHPWKDEFHASVARKDPECMRRAIANGMPINKHVFTFPGNFTPLHYAVDQGAGPPWSRC
jgi:hypothetical protein